MSRNDHEKWQMDLEEYIRQGEPEQSEKSTAWKTAIGLQDVDGLKTSEYLLETAKEHIEGRIDIKTAQKRIQSYYEQRKSRKNRFIHVDYKEQSAIQSAKVPNTKCHNGTMKMTLEEMVIIKVLQKEPSATQKRIAELTGKSERTIKRRTVEMQEKGLIRRENGKRNGRWEVLVKL